MSERITLLVRHGRAPFVLQRNLGALNYPLTDLAAEPASQTLSIAASPGDARPLARHRPDNFLEDLYCPLPGCESMTKMNEDQLMKHWSLFHSSLTKVSCPLCERFYPDKKSLRKHLRTHVCVNHSNQTFEVLDDTLIVNENVNVVDMPQVSPSTEHATRLVFHKTENFCNSL